MDRFRIMVVSHDPDLGKAVTKRLAGFLGERYYVFDCYIDRLAEAYASSCTIILGAGHCGTCDNNGRNHTISYSIKGLAMKNDKHYIPLFWVNWWPLAFITSLLIRFVMAIDQFLLESE